MDINLFDYFDEAGGGNGAQSHWALRAPYRPHDRFDLMLVPRVEGWREDRDSLAALDEVEGRPWVAAVERGESQVWLRLDDGWVAKRGAELEEGEEAVSGCGDVATGKQFALNFWDANSTKALHIGHLRNLALGNALGNALAEAGGEVERRSIICDIGRSMGEAMAGVVRSGKYPQGSENGVKSDHFVGYCYADYVKNGANGAALGLAQDHPADSLTREVDVHEDSADELLQRVLNGDQTALELWSQTRAWVISGQRKTLARLGIYFDRVFFESDFLPEVVELTELGLQEGTLEKRVDGTVIYMTGREELEEMPLVRSDGVPTQHMRALAYWLADTGLDGTTSVQVCGQEWYAHVTCRRQLMAELVHTSEGNGFHPYHDIFHGMVAREREKIASSKKDAVLIDHLVEWVDEQLEADPEREAVRRGNPTPDRVASQIALGYFLLHTATKRVDFEPEKLITDNKALGWDLARARARDESASGPAGGAQTQNGAAAEDPNYRFAVVQAETYGRLLGRVARSLEVAPLARYASHLARWQNEEERAPHVSRVVRSTLDRTARSIGLEVSA
ncbi:MAG: arginine--tRNA ligase [Solirubrobacterales bacterium]